MPVVLGDTELFNTVYEETCRSVVGIMIDGVKSGAGFVVHISPHLTVVAVPLSCTRGIGNKMINVSFFGGTTSDTNDVVQLNNGGLDLLFVGVLAGGWTQATLGQLGEGESETVLTIVPLVSNKIHRQRTYTSYIISPRCSCVTTTGSIIEETSEIFSFTLPVGNMNVHNPGNRNSKWLSVDNFTLGAPVFNVQSQWVGFTVKRSTTSRDMKLGLRGETFQHSLNTWLAGRQWEDVIRPYLERNVEHELAIVFDWY